MTNPDPENGNRIFISCVSGEFEHSTARYPGFRSLLRKALVRADCDVKVQEEFRQTEVDTIEKLDQYIRRCAAVLHFVGALPGAIAHPTAVTAYLEKEKNFLAKFSDLRAQLGDCLDLSFTQWEAFIALHHGVPLFVYTNDKALASQEQHLKRLESVARFASYFTSEAELFSQLIGDLRYIVPTFGKAAQRLGKQNFLHHTAELFLGREKELELLDTAWADGTNVLGLIAWGGVGKTALLSEWIQTRFIDKQWLAADGQPALLAYFDWSFYDQGTGSLAEGNVNRTGNVGDFFEQALAFFGDEDPTAPGKGARLAKLVRQQRTLLILDCLEPLQYPVGSPQGGGLLDPDLRDLITSLAQANPGLCVVSSRQALTDLTGLHGAAAHQQDLEDLPRSVAVRVLRQMQITGTDQELEKACDKFDCHALSITLLGRFLFDAHDGDIRRIDRVKNLHKADKLTREDRQRTAWKVLEAYDAWLAQAKADGNPRTLAVLRLTGLFDRTATADCLAALRAEPVIPGLTDAIVGMDDDEWNVLLHRLERAHLIKLRTGDGDKLSLDAHPLVREYFAEQLKTKSPETFRAAHSRLFDHLCETTPYQPDDLPGLQPLYQAVVHGCLAGRHPEAREKVYRDRILRGREFYSTKKLGAFGADLGAVAAFFDVPWSRLSSNLTPAAQAWMLNEAAFRLRALGRLTEALEPMRVSGEMDETEEEWKGAAINASNLSGLEVTLGRLTDAVSDGRRSVAFADRSGDAFERLSDRTAAADALHQAGERAAAEELFITAEQMQAADTPEYPLLYSLPGFRYVDLLLVPAERTAWQSLPRTTAILAVTNPATTSPVVPSVGGSGSIERGGLVGGDHGQDGRGTMGEQQHGQDGRGTGGERDGRAAEGEAVLRRHGAYLPHWRQEGSIYAVTFRLADSVPAKVSREWQIERQEILDRITKQGRQLSAPEVTRLHQLFSAKVEAYLHAGRGECWFNRPEMADAMQAALQHFAGERYRLVAWCVMPNHVHVVLQPLPGHTLEKIIHSWKSFTANEINRLANRTGALWQPEYYDHLIRDDEDLLHAIEYTLQNPAAAGLTDWRWVGSHLSQLDHIPRTTAILAVTNPATTPPLVPSGGGSGAIERGGLVVGDHGHDGRVTMGERKHGQDGRGTGECDEATRRANYALKIAERNNWLLDIGLDHLSLARAALYRTLITGTVPETLPQSVATALGKLGEANSLHHLPKALLTAAFHAGTLGQDPGQAKRYLDEAQLIADRGPMPLYLADVHLHRARLFRDKDELEKARKLITEFGYGRRNEELADATDAAAGW